MLGSPSPRGAKRRAIIIGGSMSGLFSAAFLRQIGWDVDVYERSTVELVGRGAGITGHPELMETLEASGAGIKDLGVEVPKRVAIDRDGRVTDERPLRQILTSWDRLQRLLRETIDESRYHLGWNFERVDQDERGVRVQFSGGRVEHADILIGGDGIRSSVRGQMAPDVQPVYAGYYRHGHRALDPRNRKVARRFGPVGRDHDERRRPHRTRRLHRRGKRKNPSH